MTERRNVLLGEVIRVKHGYAFPGEDFTDDPCLPILLTPGNFAIGGGFKTAKPKTFMGECSAEYILAPGELIISMTDLSKDGATLGLPAIVPGDAVYLHNQRIGLVQIIRPDLVELTFLQYYLRTDGYRIHILSTATGSTVRHTSPSKICSYRADLPDIGEQRAIAEVLGALDNKIAANTKLVGNATDLAALLLASELPRSPLSSVVIHQKKSVSPQLFAADRILHYSLPVFDAGQRPESADPAKIKSSKFLIEKPCVLVSKLNPRFPRIWDVPEVSGETSVASTEFLVLESKYSTSSVLWAILSQPSFRAALEAKVAGTSGSHQRVRPTDLLATEVIDPRTLSETIQDQLTSLGVCRNRYRQECDVLAATRDALLPKLISGKLRVKDAEKRVEEVL